MELFIKKVISGGQTGADRAGLEAAKKAGIKTGGYCPKGYLTEKGADKSLRKFGLIQTESKDYSERTELNIKYSDGTVIFSKTDESGNVTGIGTLLTLKIAIDSGKPVLINPDSEEFAEWIVRNNIRVLNVAGNRRSQNNDIGKIVMRFLSKNLLISDTDTVPMPAEYIKFEKATGDLKNDRISGSVSMTVKLNELLLDYVKHSDEDTATLSSNIRRNLYDFKTSDMANMVLLKDFINSVFELLNKEQTETDRREEYLTFLEEFKKQNESINRRIVEKTLKEINFVNKTVVLFSNSATVVSVFKEMAKKKTFPEIIQCESEPGKEGLVQAEILKGLGFKVRVIKDDDIDKYVKKADILLLGCDGYNDEMFVNKIGTFYQVFKFTIAEKPVYVLSDSRKYSKDSFKFTKIKDNSLFEQIPLKRVTKMITEKS